MAEALVSIALEQLATLTRQQAEGGTRLIADAEEVEKIKSNFLAIQAVLADAENREVMENAVRDWLHKVKDISYDIEDVLDEWNTTILKSEVQRDENASKPLRKVSSLIPNYLKQFVLRDDNGIKIKNLDKKLDVIAVEKDRFKFSSVAKGAKELAEQQMNNSIFDNIEIHGRDEDKNIIIDLLLTQRSQQQVLPIISIVGMGGLGKTTLARLAFDDDKVKTHFDKMVWVCVSESFNETRIAKAILESLTNQAPNLVELETMLQKIRQNIEGKKLLLVLDDVWNENPENWEQLKHTLKCSSPESRILVTTRKENVANVIETTHKISLGTLSEDDSWSLFCQTAFLGKSNEDSEKLKKVGREIVKKCQHFPLAIKTLASLLHLKTKVEEWQDVLDSEIWKIEEVKPRLLAPVLLSYNHFPSMLKKCFSYCAIFPKGYEIQKDELIKLWMAQDYLKAECNKDIEQVGEQYFKILAMHSFLHDFEKDQLEHITSFKMHNTVHDFAQFLAQTECFSIEVDDFGESEYEASYKNFRHSMLKVQRGGSFPSSIYTQKSLRSLVVQGVDTWEQRVASRDLLKIFDQLTCLRTLDLSEQFIEEIPTEIKNLMHLRYLKLSQNYALKILPETLCELHNLQILDINGCCSLQTLPQGMGKLINLRHLENMHTSSLSFLPKSFERLSGLRSINEFVISDDAYGSKACSLDCLKDFNKLQKIGIKGLGYLTDISKVKEAELCNKKNLHCLNLYFNGSEDDNNHEELLEALRPPPELEDLSIENYTGSTLFPDWIMSLTALRRLSLEGCVSCEHLPPLGKLPSLESLIIFNMKNLQRVGNEFLGIESDVTSSSSSVVTFPKLKYLNFSNMDEWEEWNYEIAKRGEEETAVMPCLKTLRISNCSKLKSLPSHLYRMATLKMETRYCPLLEEIQGSDS